MDPITIILTVAACIGGLILLYFILALIVFAIGARQAKKFVDDDDFFRPGSNPRRPRR